MADKLRVLYVDDEPSLLDISKRFLEREGTFAVDTLTSASEALDQLKAEHYDAIISDYQMPDMDGITFLKQLKGSGNSTPFIIFTGRGREEIVIEALNCGADFYIQKGGDPKSQFAELSHKIKTAVRRQKSEKLAKDTERRLYDIINFLPDATFAIDTGGNVIAWNKAIEEMTGVPAHEMLGRGNYEYALPFYGERRPILINLVSIPDEELTQDKYAIIKKEGNILIAETTLPRPLGRDSVLLGKASLLYNDEGTAIGSIESIRDITEQKRAEGELQKARDEYVDLLEHMDDVYYRSDTKGRLILASKSWAKYLGYDDLSECLYKNIADTFYARPDDRKKFLEEVYRNGSVSDYEVVLKKKDGTHLTVATSSYLKFDEFGSVVGVEGTWRDITDRKQAEEALRDSEERYRRMLTTAHEGVWILDQNWVGIFVNQHMEEMLGYQHGEILGKPLDFFIFETDRQDHSQQRMIREKGVPARYERKFKKKDGTELWTLVSATPLFDKSGAFNGTFGMLTDISERKRVEKALNESEEQSRMILSSMPDIVMVHHNGIIVYANQMAVEKTGYSEEELIGSNLFNYVKETDRETINRNMIRRATGEQVGDYEIDMIHKSGFLHHVIIRASPIVFNQLPSVVFIIIDITERKRAEDALRESEEKYCLIFENSPLGHLSFDEKGVIVACNDKMIQIIGSSRDALIGLNMLNLPDKNLVSAVQKALDGSYGLYEGVYSSVTSKKSTPVNGFFAPINFRDGRISGGMGIFEDITERKKAELLLKKSELKYRSLIESSSDAIFCVDKNGEYQFTNLVFASTFNKTPEFFIGKTFWDIYPKEHADHRQSANLKVFETGETQTIEVEVPLPDNILYFIAKANPIKDETGKIILNLTHATDITERKRAEKAIKQANQKLTLLSSITRHDINNQLTVLQGYLELVEIKQEDNNLIDYCQKAITASQRIYAMIRFTKEYESLGISAPTWHDTRKLIETAAKQAALGKVTVKNDIPAGYEVFADPLIIKVCYNLMENAVQYGKTITTIRFSVLKHSGVHIIVCKDDGVGVPAEEKEKIFERGFGKNTGLGLALSREILAITGITIRETGEPGIGAQFEMTVPKGMWRLTGNDT